MKRLLPGAFCILFLLTPLLAVAQQPTYGPLAGPSGAINHSMMPGIIQNSPTIFPMQISVFKKYRTAGGAIH